MEAQTGLWTIEMDEGKAPRMYADSAMLKLLGLASEPTPERCYQHWYERIEESYYPVIQTAVDRISRDERAEVEYPWIHPDWGKIYVRCGGVRDQGYQNGICLRGYHQNITNTVTLKKDYDSVIESLSASYSSIFICNLADKKYKIVKLLEKFRPLAESCADIEGLLHQYVEQEVALQYRRPVLDLIKDGGVAQKFADGEKLVELYFRSISGAWQKVKVVPSNQYSPDQPVVIAAFSEVDREVEQRFGDATSHIALSQIYVLVVSLDMARKEYACIHYSGELLDLADRGNLEDLYLQLSCKMPTEDRKALREIFDQNQYESCRYRDGEFRLSDSNGGLHYFSYYSSVVREDLGERILLTVRNVDEKQGAKQREDILSNLCRCYYSIYLFDLENNTEEALWQEDFIHRKREFPKGPLDIYYEKFIQNYVYEEDQARMRRAGSPEFLRLVLSEGQPVYEVDFRRVYPEGLVWVRSRFSMVETRDGLVTKVIFANMNINEQKLEELEEEKHRQLYFEYRNIVQGFSAFYQSVFYVDLNTQTFQTFKADENLLPQLDSTQDYGQLKQVFSRNIAGKDGPERFIQENSISEILRRIGDGETIYSLDYQWGYGGWVRIHVILAESRDGVPAKIILAAHNVDAEKEQEEQNRKALLAAYETVKAANDAKSSFLAQMSHDIRTPINAIMGMTAIAASQVADPLKVSDCLNKIDLSSKHLLTMINEILDLSKIEKGRLELADEFFSLTGLIRDTVEMIRADSSQKRLALSLLTTELVHDRLIGDTSRLRQVLLNLLTNAVKYTPEGGRILLKAQEVSQREPGWGSFVITVEDTGIGMDKDFLDYVFVPFSRADCEQVRGVQGSGLGMAIAQKLISAMGGNIQVESELGRGSRFTVTLNLKIDESARDQVEKENIQGEMERETCLEDGGFSAGKSLLLAEDNELNMEIAQTILISMGFNVRGVRNGKEAVEVFSSSEPGTYHAVLMDLQMPVMDGFTAAHEIRISAHPQADSIPIIALTANAFAQDIAKTLAAGMNDHVSKPIDFDRLLRVLKKYIAG